MWKYLHKKYKKLYYETSLDDASRYKYMWSLIHWRAIVLSEKSVPIVRWTLLVFVVFELDRVRCTMKIQYSGINSWVYILFSCTCGHVMYIFSPAMYRESPYTDSAFIDFISRERLFALESKFPRKFTIVVGKSTEISAEFLLCCCG